MGEFRAYWMWNDDGVAVTVWARAGEKQNRSARPGMRQMSFDTAFSYFGATALTRSDMAAGC
jgi:hypothetical protein